MSYIFDGKNKSEIILKKVLKELQKLKNKPSLAIIRLGSSPEQLKFTNIKQQTAIKLGLKCNLYEYSQTTTTDELIKTIENISNSATGILVQLPLPEEIDRDRILNAIPYSKDVEGLSDLRFDKLADCIPDVYSPVAKAIVETTKEAVEKQNLNIKDLKILIMGKSHLVGHPVKLVLSKLSPNVDIVDIVSNDINSKLKNSDVVISAIGQPHFIKAEKLKEGLIAIDAGFEINEDGKIFGDFDPDVKNKASFYTPVPGGIGPLTIAYIFDNLIHL